MKCPTLIVFLIGFVTSTCLPASESTTDSVEASPEAVEAWKDMRFGMFLCWGPVSLTGKEIGWSRQPPAYGKERGFRCALRPRENTTATDVYDGLYEEWQPDEFDARHWVTVAKESGMKYLIFLVKHHDGFCLYDTKLTEYKSTGPRSAWKVDVMKAVAGACHEADLKLIIYYSQPDWHHPDYLGEQHQRYVKYLHGQIRELLTGYGRIDGLWFDNLRPVGPETAALWNAEELFKTARSIQPHLIINNRCGLPGDFDTPEQRIGHFQPDRPWESCCTLGTQWAWKPDDTIKSFQECIYMLVGSAIGDGNLALNTNPMPDGRIEPRQVERFQEIGRWMTKYGESIYGTRGGPFTAPYAARARWRTRDGFSLPSGPWWGGSTRKDNVAYLHVLHWPNDTINLPGIGCRVVSHSVLTGGEATVNQTDEGIEVAVPKSQRDPVDTIIKLQFDQSLDGIDPVPGGPKPLVPGAKTSASGVWSNPRLDAVLAFDGDPGTRWGGAPDTTAGWLAVDFGKPVAVNRAVIDEGDWDRVRRFELQHRVQETWKTIVSGTTLGPAKELEFNSVEAQHFRLNILEASNVPTIWEVQLYAE